jgi:hypothetical protein
MPRRSHAGPTYGGSNTYRPPDDPAIELPPPEDPATAYRRPGLVPGWLWGVLAALLVSFLSWGAKSWDAGKLDTSRFVADSIRRDAQRDLDHALLLRIDSASHRTDVRLSAVWCAGKPAGCQ